MREHALIIAIIGEILALSATGYLVGHGVLPESAVQLVAIASIVVVTAAYIVTRRVPTEGTEAVA